MDSDDAIKRPAQLLAPTVHVGVTGHTKLPPAAIERVREMVSSVLVKIRAAANKLSVHAHREWPDLLAAGKPRLRLLCGLAPGTDQLVAELVDTSGRLKHLEFEILPILPAPAAEYAAGHYFKPHPDARQRLLIHAARATTLDGPVLGSSTAASPEIARLEHESQQDAGDLMVGHSDILLAVIDPNYREGRSESHRIVAAAKTLGIPVIEFVLGNSADVALRVLAGPGAADIASESDWELRILQSMLVPPQSGSPQHGAYAKAPSNRSVQLQRFLRESTDAEGTPLSRYGNVWVQFEQLFADDPPRILESRDEPSLDQHSPTPQFRDEYKKLDAFAARCMRLYRSSFVLNYTLGAIAVTLAFLSFAAARHGLPCVHSPATVAHSASPAGDDDPHQAETSLTKEQHADSCDQAAFALGVAEFFLILLIVINFVVADRSRWQDRATDYRLLAEFFRSAAALAPFGRVPPFPRPGGHTPEDPRRTWIAWYFRAVVRAAGPRVGNVGQSATEQARVFRESALIEQIRYHARTAQKYSNIHHRLEKVVTTLFGLTLFACFIHVLAGMGYLPCHLPHFLHQNESWVALVVVVLPAWAGAAHAIGTQTDSKRLHQNSAAMRTALSELFARLSRPFKTNTAADIESEIPAPDSPVPISAREAVRVVVEATEVMIAEAAEWRIAYRMPHTTPP